MAHFRGTVKGNRGEASRLGTKKSELRAVATSWEGRVSVWLWYNETKKCDYAQVSLEPHCSEGTYKQLYYGPVSGAPEPKE